ncbi:MAG TPA: hypothetical protein PLU55_03180 [Candidatus Pacearchaeota archaeon]|nr:hypothetical protein [Candidatus Pacearchaeota archaeon]
MSFTQTTLLNKAGYFAFLSKDNLAEDYDPVEVVSLINAAQYIARNLLGTTPIMVTSGSEIMVDANNPPQSLLYCCKALPSDVMISTNNLRSAFVILNDSELYNIDIGIDTQTAYTLAPGQMILIVTSPYKTSVTPNYLIFEGVIPYGWTAEDMSLKVGKGDEVRISTGDTMVQSAITEVNLPGYEQFSFFTNGKPSAIDSAYTVTDIDLGLIPASLRYLLIVPVLPYNEFVDIDGVYAGVPIYQIDLLNGVTISQEWNANQPNKSTLSFKKDAGFNEEIAVPIYVE